MAILQLPRSAPKYFQKINITMQSNNRSLYFITPAGVVDMNERVKQSSFSSSYYSGSYCNYVKEDDLSYDIEHDGLCGSWIVNGDGMLLGMHILGATIEENGVEKCIGVAKLVSSQVLKNLLTIVEKPVGFVLETKEISKPDFSGVMLTRKSNHYASGKNTIVPSLVHGVFPIEREPAKIENPKIMKELSDGSFDTIPICDLETVAFAESGIYESLQLENFKYTCLSERELVLGNDILNRIDPSTSPGVDHPGEKSDYLDYETGTVRTKMKDKMKSMCDSIVKDEFAFDVYYASTLKMELRDVVDGKPKPPRVFQAGPLILTLFYRLLFGSLMSFVYENKFTNGIMIGINPLGKDWDVFARRILKRSGKNICPGDFKWWDKRMHASLQRACNRMLKSTVNVSLFRKGLNDLLGTQYTLEDVNHIIDELLELIISTPIILLDLVIITTHNLPSGMGITAFYNSVIHKMVTLYVYGIRCKQLQRKPRIDEFLNNVDDYVYGDDKLMVVSDAFRPIMAPVEFAGIVRSIGLDFTTADKKPWDETNSYVALTAVSFLKRSFLVHPTFGRWVAPLEEKSMTSTLNYISDELREEELCVVKILNFQREAFLHYDKYSRYMDRIKSFLTEHEIDLTIKYLSPTALKELYSSDDYGSLLNLS
jgi:hypothetical protein